MPTLGLGLSPEFCNFAGTAFDPSQLANLRIWLDGADIPGANGDAVVAANWTNRGAAGNPSTGGGTVTKTTNAINGVPAASFAAPFSYIQSPYVPTSGTSAFTTFLVVQTDTYSEFPNLFGSIDSNELSLGGSAAASHLVSVSRSGAATYSSNQSLSLGSFQILCFKSVGRSFGSSILTAIYVNGVLFPGTLGDGSFINSVNNFFGPLTGKIAEIITVSDAMFYGDQRNVLNWLSERFGIAIAALPSFSATPGGLLEYIGTPTPIITVGAGGQYDDGLAQQPSLMESGGNTYVAYAAWNASNVGSIGLYSGSSLATLSKVGQILTASGGLAYVSGPRLFLDQSNVLRLFVFGSTVSGFEGVPAALYVATSNTSLPTGTFTLNTTAILAPGTFAGKSITTWWRAGVIYAGGLYHFFINGTNNTDGDIEQIWHFTCANSDGSGGLTLVGTAPCVDVFAGAATRVGDPVIRLRGSTYVMTFFGQTNSDPARQYLATSSDLNTWTIESQMTLVCNDFRQLRADWSDDLTEIAFDNNSQNIWRATAAANS